MKNEEWISMYLYSEILRPSMASHLYNLKACDRFLIINSISSLFSVHYLLMPIYLLYFVKTGDEKRLHTQLVSKVCIMSSAEHLPRQSLRKDERSFRYLSLCWLGSCPVISRYKIHDPWQMKRSNDLLMATSCLFFQRSKPLA